MPPSRCPTVCTLARCPGPRSRSVRTSCVATHTISPASAPKCVHPRSPAPSLRRPELYSLSGLVSRSTGRPRGPCVHPICADLVPVGEPQLRYHPGEGGEGSAVSSRRQPGPPVPVNCTATMLDGLASTCHSRACASVDSACHRLCFALKQLRGRTPQRCG